MMNQSTAKDHLQRLMYDLKRYGNGFSGASNENSGKKGAATVKKIGACLLDCESRLAKLIAELPGKKEAQP